MCFLLVLLHSAPLVETCETKSVPFTPCGPGLLCMCAGGQDQESLKAQAIPQHPSETSTPFSLHSPAMPVTLIMVVAKVVVASMRACKVMTTDRVCSPSRNLVPSCTARYPSYARYDQSLPECPRERNWQGKVFNVCCITVVISNQKRHLWPNGLERRCLAQLNASLRFESRLAPPI